MKISIGPYLNFWGIYQVLGLLNHVGISEDTTHRWAENAPDWIANFFQWAYNKRNRKIKVHIDPWDTWNMDATLAIIILPMLKQLQATKHGAAGDMAAFQQTSNQSQGSFDFYAEGDAMAWDVGHKQWEDILGEIIWTFEQLQQDCDWEDQYWKTRPELDLTDYPEDEGKLCVPVRWKVEGECDWDGMRKHRDRIRAGLELFGKYYMDLWD